LIQEVSSPPHVLTEVKANGDGMMRHSAETSKGSGLRNK
jgi:hypothetical protein